MKKLVFFKYVIWIMTGSMAFAACKTETIADEAYDISYLAQPVPSAGPGEGEPVKELYIPTAEIWAVSPNDFNDDNSPYSFFRKVESANFAVFWNKEYGADIEASAGISLSGLLGALEDNYKYYANVLKFVEVGNSLTDKYKMLVFIRPNDVGSANGGGAADSIGVFWSPASRLTSPYATLAHELGHSFQYMVLSDGHDGPTGLFWEHTSQWMTWLTHPDWFTLENYHLVNFMDNTHVAFLDGALQYAAPHLLMYWTNKHGNEMVGRVWREAVKPEDAVTTYKRITNITQSQFNDETFDAYRRFITWDLEVMDRAEATKYANQHYTTLTSVGDGWYRIIKGKCPQNYGYNGIKLDVPAAGTTVHLDFKGVAGTAGYNAIRIDKAGWRYGFVASKSDGSRVYSDIFSDTEGSAEFVVPENTTYLWLVVSGAPTEHVALGNADAREEWPYQIKLNGTTLSAAMIQ